MRLAPGTRLGSYEVIGSIGAGGMGEVYRARDTVLHREIALKLVHPDYCHHPESLDRLRREARALAAVNHPNVATLHGLAEFDGSCGLVMELVGGETLADLLRHRKLPIAETLGIAAQIAAALEAAHERGITHRDLKPANIKIAGDGMVKVLDFGLAKAEATEPEAASASTLMTEPGVVLGTAPYMSPEQARGAPVDRRTDVWAFGCVLFEMLTGRLAFGGNSRSDIVVSILDREPDWSQLPAHTPPTLRRLLKRCLEKDARSRVRDIGDIRLELEDIRTSDPADNPGGSTTAPVARTRWFRSGGLIAAGAITGALAVFAWQPALSSARPNEVRFAIALSDEERPAVTELGGVAIAGDGRTIVYVAARGSTTQLIMRSLDSGSTRVLQGTTGGVSPFFSPDGQWVAFFAEGKLKKMPLNGGAASVICDAADGLGGSWSSNGTIVFAAATGGPLLQVPASGGTASRFSELDVSRGEFSHRWPEFLPDGNTVLFSVGTVGEWSEAEIASLRLSDRTRTTILKGGTNPRYLASGHLAYAHDSAIWVAPFDLRSLTTRGEPQRALEAVTISADGAAQFAISREGTSVYQPSVAWSARRLVVVDGASQTPLAAPPHAYVTPRVSPDARRVLLGIADTAEHIWSYDLSAGMLTQLTFDASNRSPVWSPDGQRVLYSSNRNGALNLFVSPATEPGSPERLTTSESLQVPGSLSPDGETLAFVEQHPSTGRDVWLLRRSDGSRSVFANSDADESAPRFSPDGRWIAYVSNQTGQAEVYVRSMASAVPQRVSTEGGSEPVWRRDGGELYYRSYGKLMAAAVGRTPQTSRVVTSIMTEPGTFDSAGYDAMGNDRFLMIAGAASGATTSELRVILNWAPASPSSR